MAADKEGKYTSLLISGACLGRRGPRGPAGPPPLPGAPPPPTGLALALLALRKCGGTYEDFVTAAAGATGSGVSSLGAGSEISHEVFLMY